MTKKKLFSSKQSMPKRPFFSNKELLARREIKINIGKRF